jgi:hypothetical protein
MATNQVTTATWVTLIMVATRSLQPAFATLPPVTTFVIHVTDDQNVARAHMLEAPEPPARRLEWIGIRVLWADGSISRAGSPGARHATPRIRPTGEYERRLLTDGTCRSDTFRRLVDRLHQSDLIVYVTAGRFKTMQLSGGLQFVVATETARILRVQLDLSLDREHLIVMLGHELQHAVEVANAPEVGDKRIFAEHYRLHGLPSVFERAWDTREARRLEAKIRAELPRRTC